RDHFQQGRTHYELKEYAEALKEFKDGYRVVRDPVFLFNIAQCHWKLGDIQVALGFYRDYLRRAPGAANRAEVEKRIEELEKQAKQAKPAPRQPAPPPPLSPPAPPPPAKPAETPKPPETGRALMPPPVAPPPVPPVELQSTPRPAGDTG